MSRESAILTLVNAALERAENQYREMYVYCTSTDWIISDRHPDFHRQHIRVEPGPEPRAVMCEYDFMTGRWSERVISTPVAPAAPPAGDAAGEEAA